MASIKELTLIFMGYYVYFKVNLMGSSEKRREI
jgi:hypothetical protein